MSIVVSGVSAPSEVNLLSRLIIIAFLLGVSSSAVAAQNEIIKTGSSNSLIDPPTPSKDCATLQRT